MDNHPRQREIVAQEQSEHEGGGVTANVEDQWGHQVGTEVPTLKGRGQSRNRALTGAWHNMKAI